MAYHIKTMAGLKSKMGLTIASSVLDMSTGQSQVADIKQNKVHKKYLGEPDDLHFIPDSPLIERQFFTEQEEGELKRICALALAAVPHSDDMTDDPLKYVAAQIQTQPKAETSKSMPDPLPEVPTIPVGGDSATPSDGSKRDTMDRTDYSTPLTSAGITPGEPHRFSDAGRRASSSKGSSHLKHESTQRTKSRAISTSHSMPRKSIDAKSRKSHEARKPSGEQKLVDRTLRIVPDQPRYSETIPRPAEPKPARYSQLELNKQLPPLPRSETEPSPSTPNPMARMLKTIKKKKSQLAETRSQSISVSSTPPMPALPPESRRPRQKSMPAVPALQALPPTLPEVKKRSFKLPFFNNRKERPQTGILAN
jgi:hypothetical protein